MKTWLTGISLFLYAVIYSTYIVYISSHYMELRHRDLFKASAIGSMLLITLIFELLGVKCYIQKQFILASKLIIIFTFIIIALTNLCIVTNPYYLIGVLYLGTALATLMITISGGRHELFKD